MAEAVADRIWERAWDVNRRERMSLTSRRLNICAWISFGKEKNASPSELKDKGLSMWLNAAVQETYRFAVEGSLTTSEALVRLRPNRRDKLARLDRRGGSMTPKLFLRPSKSCIITAEAAVALGLRND
jgi:hypothetical protein